MSATCSEWTGNYSSDSISSKSHITAQCCTGLILHSSTPQTSVPVQLRESFLIRELHLGYVTVCTFLCSGLGTRQATFVRLKAAQYYSVLQPKYRTQPWEASYSDVCIAISGSSLGFSPWADHFKTEHKLLKPNNKSRGCCLSLYVGLQHSKQSSQWVTEGSCCKDLRSTELTQPSAQDSVVETESRDGSCTWDKQRPLFSYSFINLIWKLKLKVLLCGLWIEINVKVTTSFSTSLIHINFTAITFPNEIQMPFIQHRSIASGWKLQELTPDVCTFQLAQWGELSININICLIYLAPESMLTSHLLVQLSRKAL